jgi:Ran GTPase-activating protein (RanGAP) involved in mRNA processing and transport
LVHCWNNLLQDAGAKAFAEIFKLSPLLEDVKISSTRIAEQGCLALVKSLDAARALKRLDLGDNTFGTEATVALVALLNKHKQLQAVVLDDAGFEGKNAIVQICGALKELSDLEELVLSGDELNAKNVDALVQALNGKKKLKRLILSDNELESAGAKKLCVALKHSNLTALQVLDVCNNQIDGAGAVTLVGALLEGREPSVFQSIQINGNSINSKALQEIQALIKKHKFQASVLGSMDQNEDEDEEQLD